MTNYVGVNGTIYRSGIRLGGGGEGDILSVENNNRIVLKIYKNRANKEKEEKILAMIRSKLSSSEYIAWPKDAVYCNGIFEGYVMQRIDGGKPVNLVYEFGSKSESDKYPLNKRIVIARNICALLDDIHREGFVVGDFNPNNILINPKTAHVKFVDTDSYHIITKTKTYRCTVGMQNYIPSEISRIIASNGDLETVQLPTFTMDSDNFSLAIHIFQLLMNGSHPYQGAIIDSEKTDSEDLLSIPDNIRRGFSPYFKRIYNLTVPIFSPNIDSLPKYICDLFLNAFINGTINPKLRPDPVQWSQALERFFKELKMCDNRKHLHYIGCVKCPYCEVEERYNKMIKPIENKPTKDNSIQIKDSAKFYEYDYSTIIGKKRIITSDMLMKIIAQHYPIEERFLIYLLKKTVGTYYQSQLRALATMFKIKKRKCFKTYYLEGQGYNNIICVPKNDKKRDIEYFSLEEMMCGVAHVIKKYGTIEKDLLISETAHLLGYSRTGSKITQYLE